MTFRRFPAGRYWSYELDGDRVKSVTTVISGGIPKPNLITWAARLAAETLADHADELADPDKRDAALDWAIGAHTRARNSQAAKGSDIHGYAQRLAGGEHVDVPDRHAAYVDAYLKWIEEWQPEYLAIEAGVANRRWTYAGSIDLLANIGSERNRLCALVDIKTGASGIWPEACLQVAAYRQAEVILDPAGHEQPMPHTDEGLGLWLRDDGNYELVRLESGDDMFKVFLHARQIAAFMSRAKDDLIGLPMAAPAKPYEEVAS